MKYLLIACLLLSSCGGKLSDDQRKRLHDGMSTQDIRKISESDLQEAAYALAESIVGDIEKTDRFLKSPKIDSIARARVVSFYSIIPDDSTLREIEKKLVDAYLSGADAGQASDNLQRVGDDSLLFTRPVFKNRPDGSQEFSHAIGIRMSKKTIVLSMPQP
jgi:hypothetical protein